MFLNTLAHLGGRAFSSLAGLVVTTLVTAILGPAAMGIFGLYMVIQNLMGILDGGMSVTINRAMAIGALGNAPDTAHLRLLRTYEMMNSTIGFLIALIVMVAFHWILQQWHTSSAEAFDVGRIGIFLALALGLRFMQQLYQNVLFGAHQHFYGNLVISSFAILRAVLIGGGLLLFKLGLTDVFKILAFSNGSELLALIFMARLRGLWRLRTLPDWHLLKENAHFMAPITGYAIVGVLISQLDRIIIGHFVSLEEFGAYALIATYAVGVAALAYAPGNVFYPTFTQAVHHQEFAKASHLVRRMLHLVMVLTVIPCLWAVFYGADISPIIFSRPDVAAMTAPLWAPLFLAIAINVLTLIPHKVFLAHGRSDLVFKINAAIVFIYAGLLLAALFVLGYPAGVYALAVIFAFSVAGYLFCLWRLGPAEREDAKLILRHTAIVFTLFLMLFAALHAVGLPAVLWQKLCAIALPLLISTAGYFYVVEILPRQRRVG